MFITKDLLKSWLAFCQRDVAKPHGCVYLQGSVAVATDGHAAVCHLVPGEPVTGSVARADLERLAKLVSKHGDELISNGAMATCAGLAVALGTKQAPPVGHILDSCRADRVASPVAVNPALLARLAPTARAVGTRGAMLRLGGELEPIRADMVGPHGWAVALVMPMRTP